MNKELIAFKEDVINEIDKMIFIRQRILQISNLSETTKQKNIQGQYVN